MCKVTYDYKDAYGFIQTEVIRFYELKKAFAFLRTLSCRKDIIGKPCIERI